MLAARVPYGMYTPRAGTACTMLHTVEEAICMIALQIVFRSAELTEFWCPNAA